MIEELARVKSLAGDKAVVEVMRQSGCQGCQMNASCGTGSIGRLLGFRGRPLVIDNNHNLQIGDRVVIGLQDNAYVTAAVLVYLLPLLLMLVFAILADVVLRAPDAMVALVAVGGLGSGIYLSAQIARLYFQRALSPRTIRRVG